MPLTRQRGLRLATTALVAVAVLALTACGDDDDDDAGDSGSSAPRPTGPAISIGFLSQENSPVGSFPEYAEGAIAASEYINSELGGVSDRPIEIEKCVTNGSGESSIGCANQFVQSGKLAVMHGIETGADGSVPIFAQAGVPYLGGNPLSPAEFTSPNSFAFVGAAPGGVSALSRFVAEQGAKKVSILTTDVPAARLAIDNFSIPVLRKLGVTDVTPVFDAATAADFTPALTKANDGNPDAIIVLFGSTACSKIMQASASIGVDPTKVFYVGTCANREQLEAGGAGAVGARFQSDYLPIDTDDPDVATFREAMQKYAPDANLGSGTQNGFASVMNLYNILQKNPGDITKESIAAGFKAAVSEPNFMGHPYTCDGKQIPGLTAMCNAYERIVEYRDGELKDVSGDWVEGASLIGP